MKRVLLFLPLIFVLGFIQYLKAQELKWIYKIGGLTAEYGNGLAIDNQQNVYDITNFMGTVAVANNLSYTSRGAEDILIRKSTGLGILQWVRQVGGGSQDISYDISSDADNNVFVVGTFRDSLYFEGGLILTGQPGTQSSFIIKLDTDGDLLMARKFESDSSIQTKSVTAGQPGELVISGTFEGNAFFGQGQSAISQGGNDIFVLKMNGNSGEIIYLKQIGGADQEYVHQHCRDAQNNIYLIGDYRAQIDLNPGNQQAIFNTNGLTDLFLVKLNSSGEYQWAKTYGGIGVDYGHTVTVDHLGSIIIAGRYSESVSFGSPVFNLTSRGGTDIFLVKLDQNGNTTWANSYGDTLHDEGQKVIVNNNGIIYLAGIFRGRVDFDSSFEYFNGNESNGGTDVFVAVYNQDGSYNDHFVLGGIANDEVRDIALKSNGDLISTGGFAATVDFDPGPVEINIFSTGGLDAFLLNTFICINPYIKSVQAAKPEICLGERAFIQVVEGYLNNATQWSWQRDSCDNITFASGDFLQIPVVRNTSFYLKGYGGCVVDERCKKIDITVFKDSLIEQRINLCEGDSITVGTNVYRTAGLYVDSLISVSGCDSVVISDIYLYPTYFYTQSFQICNGDTIKVGNSNYTSSGTFTNVFQSIHGCDSVVVSIVTLLPSLIENVEATICKGQFITIGNQVYSASGTYIQSTIGENGCEDFLIVKINVLETEFYRPVSFCQGDSIVVGTNIYRNTGLYIDSLTSSYGCDSVIITDLIVLRNTFFFQDIGFCNGDSIVVGTNVYKNTGNYIDTLTNAAGCDSVVFTDIRVFPVPAITEQSLTICEGDSISVGNIIYKNGGRYRDTLQTIYGCDSIVVTQLEVLPRLYTIFGKICSGTEITFGDETFDVTGTYNIPFQNYLGCDSIIVFHLAVIEVSDDTVQHTICPGDSVIVGNQIYKEPGTYRDTLIAKSGCDSLVTSVIRFNHTFKALDFAICEGTSVTVNGKDYRQAGIFQDTLLKNDGCDSILQITITVNPVFRTDTVFEICRGGSVIVGNSTYFNAGIYAEPLVSKNGCDSTVYFEVKIINFVPVFFGVRDTLKAFRIDGAAYQWYECINGEKVPYLGAVQPEFPLFKSGKYALGITYKGCTYLSDCFDFILSGTTDAPNEFMQIYPNPVSDILNIRSEWDTKLVVRDASSRLIITKDIKHGDNQLDVSGWKPGLYIIEYSEKGTPKQFRLIKL